ncbi:hypothetical protein MMC29_006651 [Sticta canariensis]|nr:hypothetical protein [Sticta canariensis]
MLSASSETSPVATNPVTMTEPSRFLCLPLKIRREIYRYVLLDDIGVWVDLPLRDLNCRSFDSESESDNDGRRVSKRVGQKVSKWLEIPWRAERPILAPPPSRIGILSASRQIYQEVLPILYHEREFHYQLGSGFESITSLTYPHHPPQFYNNLKNLSTSIFWENAPPSHIIWFFSVFALPVSRWNFRIQLIVLSPTTNIQFGQWFIRGVAGLTAFESVSFCMRYRLTEGNYERGHYSEIKELLKDALGPAMEDSFGLHFRPKDYNQQMRAQQMKEGAQSASQT